MLKFYVYELKLTTMEEDWHDAKHPGILKPFTKIVNQVILDDPSDNLCIGGYGKDGNYYQFDSYEAFYSFEYFDENFEKHGLFVESYAVQIPYTELAKFKVE